MKVFDTFESYNGKVYQLLGRHTLSKVTKAYDMFLNEPFENITHCERIQTVSNTSLLACCILLDFTS